MPALFMRYNRIMIRAPGARWSICFAALLFLAAIPPSAPAQDASSNFDLEGKITQQSKGRLTVDTGQGILFHVTYDEKTSIVRADSSAGSEQDLKVGVKVHAVGDLLDSGDIKAARIEIKDAGSAPSSSNVARPPEPYGSPHSGILWPLPFSSARW